MTDPTAEFFNELQRQGHLPLMEKVSGTLRFDSLEGKDTSQWFVTIKKGDVTVSRQGGRTDCVIRGDKALVDGMWSGEVNPMAAVLRGELDIEGDIELMVLFQRILPGPAASRSSRTAEPVGSRS
jgi:predicted lipid carrier protein YhbT